MGTKGAAHTAFLSKPFKDYANFLYSRYPSGNTNGIDGYKKNVFRDLILQWFSHNKITDPTKIQQQIDKYLINTGRKQDPAAAGSADANSVGSVDSGTSRGGRDVGEQETRPREPRTVAVDEEGEEIRISLYEEVEFQHYHDFEFRHEFDDIDINITHEPVQVSLDPIRVSVDDINVRLDPVEVVLTHPEPTEFELRLQEYELQQMEYTLEQQRLELFYDLELKKENTYSMILRDLGSWGNPSWMDSDVQEGDVRLSKEDTYYKTFYFFTGSVINRDNFPNPGYQTMFDWKNTFKQMYYQKIVYPVKETYTLVSESSFTTDFTAAGGEVNTRTEKEFEWMETHLNPAVETTFVQENVHVYPGAVGIAGQTGEETQIRSESTGTGTRHAHEMAYTDNPLLAFTYHDDTKLDVAISSVEEDFLFSIFGFVTDDVPAAVEIAINNLGASVFGILDVNRYAYDTSPEDILIEENGGIL